MSDSVRAIHLGILVSAAIACGWAFGAHRATVAEGDHRSPEVASSSDPARQPLLVLLPPGAAFVLTADVRQLQRAPLGELLAQRLGNLGRTAELGKACGFDPLARLDQLLLAVPSADLAAQEHPEDFGIVAQGRFTGVEIVRCARAVIGKRGGEAIETRLGSFQSLRDRKSSGEVAAKDGTLIVSGGSYFRELLDAAEGHGVGPRAASDARHSELRRALGRGSIVATWLLDAHWFERVAGDATNARLSPLAALQAVAARIDIDVQGGARIRLLLDCADAEAATRIALLLTELRSSLHALPLDAAVSGLAERVTVSQAGARLTLGVAPSRVELTALLGLLLGP